MLLPLLACVLQQTRAAAPVLPEVVVTATRREDDLHRAPRSTVLITAEDLARKRPRSVPEILREEAGIHLQQTNPGGGSPILRGLVGPQILILVDGVRLNNATFRFGPNQYLNTIDPATIERIEVVRGLSSVLYGSDAVGGVIQIFTKRRRTFEPGLHAGGEVAGRFDTAYEGRSGSLTLEGNAGDIGFAGVGSLRKFEDLRAGADRGTEPNIGYGPEGDLHGAWTMRLSEFEEVSFVAQLVNQRDVPRSDRLNGGPGGPPQDLVNEIETQRRELYLLEYVDREPGPLADEVRWTLSLQRTLEENEERRIGSNNLREGDFRDRVFGLGFQAHRSLPSLFGEVGHVLTFGGELYFDDVLASRTQTDVTTGTSTSVQPQFPDGSHYRSLGVYLQDEIAVTERLDLVAGARWSQFAFDADLPAPVGSVRNDFDQFTGALDLGWDAGKGVRLVGGIAQGFRSPNLDDLTAFSTTGLTLVDAPNPDLDPEIYRGFEVGARVQRPRWSAGLVYHFTQIRDLIQRVPGTFQGMPVFIKENVGRAFIEGIETDARVDLGRGFGAFSNAFWTVGLVTTGDDEPFRRIPPLQGVAGLAWEEPEAGRWWASITLDWADEQKRLNPEDEADIRIGPDGTEGYGVLNLRVGHRFGKSGDLFVALENATDLDYRVHGSGFNAPGRNLVVGAVVRF